MARLKTIGFEQNDLTQRSELYEVGGNPLIVTNYDPNKNIAVVWNDLTEEWDSMVVSWPISLQDATFDPAGIRSGLYAMLLHAGDTITVPATIKGGGGYFRFAGKLRSLPPSDSNAFMSFRRSSDNKSMVAIDLAPSGLLSFNYRGDAADPGAAGTPIAQFTAPLQVGRYYVLEIAIIGNEAGTNRHIEARVDGVLFAQADVTDLSATDGTITIGSLDFAGGEYEMYVDDLAINDATTPIDDPDNNSWPGLGKIVLVPVLGNDEEGNSGWSRGGTDTGTDWGQVADSQPPDDTKYLIGGDLNDRADFKLGNVWDAGLKAEDTIVAVVAGVRHKLAVAGTAGLSVYLRAGSALPLQGHTKTITNTDFFTGDPNGAFPDWYSTRRLPQSTRLWSVEDLAAARIGVLITEATTDVHISGLWIMVEYVPYGTTTDYSIKINGVERSQDVKLQSLSIKDNLNEQVNTADFQLYDLHSIGIPNTDDTIIITVNGVRVFGGDVAKVKRDPIGDLSDVYTISCTDWTRTLDRRKVAATFQALTDKQLFDQVVDQYVDDLEIDTYYVAPFATINQISANYIPPSQVFQAVAELTSRSWYIDYYKHLRYFPVAQLRAPFQITPHTAFHKNLSISKDGTRLRNRVFVRGGTEQTTSPFVESQIADGQQRQFVLGEKPKDLSVTVNGTPETVGIKNINDPADFQWLMNFQEKYIEAGSGRTTPLAGDDITVTYNYDVPILVSVEDTASVAENGVYEHAIIDKQIATSQQAKDRAAAELADYAADLVDATYQTYEPGLRTGMYQRVTKPNMAIDEDYLITKLTLRSLGGGQFVYDVTLTNAKLLGIIKFMIELLKTDRRVGEFDPNEKVDQLLTLADNLDSLQDSLLIDSQGPGFPWATDSLAPATSLKWDLGQWS